MFNSDFFPTPTAVIDRMTTSMSLSGRVILEPSAGSGNIVDYLNNAGAKEVIVCEKEDDLARIVSQKARFLCSDFLDVRSTDISHVDAIIMNPPFSDEERHILHAWDIAPAGCEIVSLCNNTVLENGFSKARVKISALIREHGRSENFGDCFSDAERKTGVEVGCIWLYKPKSGDDEFDGYFDLSEEEEQSQAGIVQYNYVRDLVSRYVQAVSMYDEVMEASNTINEITKPISTYGIKFGAYYNSYDKKHSEVTRDIFKKELQKQCWEKIFNDFKMDKYLTKGVRENMNKFVETQVHVPFTVRNVYKMLELIVGTHASRMGKVLTEAFDLICSYAPENSTANESWRTNSDYMINKRFIVPYICDYDKRWPHDYVKLQYSRNRDEIEDINKALCLLTGTNYDSIIPLYNFVQNTTGVQVGYNNKHELMPMLWGQWYDWNFFRVRGYKKGTMHFEFKDEKVWEQFNMEVAKAKGWRLPKQTNKRSRKAK